MPPQTWLLRSEPGRLAPGARLLACVAVIAATWLWALPQVAKTPAVSRMIDRNEALGINPSAKFYTELPLMPRILERLEKVRIPGIREGEAPAEPGRAYQRTARPEPRPPGTDND